MSKIESKTGKISHSDQKIYTFLSDFNNIENLIPKDKVNNWQSDSESCSFSIAGIGDAGLRFIEKIEYSLLKISSEGKSPVSFLMWIQLKSLEENDTAVKITIDPQVNPIMMGMIKGPLKEFVDMLVDRLEKMEF